MKYHQKEHTRQLDRIGDHSVGRSILMMGRSVGMCRNGPAAGLGWQDAAGTENMKGTK